MPKLPTRRRAAAPALALALSLVLAARHDIRPREGHAAPPGTPPAFAWIARNHPEYLDGAILRPHPPMLGVVITAAQGRNLRAYFDRLRVAAP